MKNMKKEFEMPDIEEREKVISKVMCLLFKYSGSTVDDIKDALGLDWWDAYQAVEALKGRGCIYSECIENTNTEVYKPWDEEYEERMERMRK